MKDPHMFYASTVRRAVEMKAPFLQCLKFFHTIMVTDMQGKYEYLYYQFICYYYPQYYFPKMQFET